MAELVFRSVADRAIPEPTLKVERGETFLVLDHLGEGSTFAAEQQSLPGNGFGRMIHCDYFDLAKARANEHVEQHGWRVVRDDSSVAGIRMLVEPADPRQASAFAVWMRAFAGPIVARSRKSLVPWCRRH